MVIPTAACAVHMEHVHLLVGRRPARACEAELGAVLLQGPCPVAGLRMLCLGAAGEPLERSAGLLYAFMINFVRITHGTSPLSLRGKLRESPGP